jgi:prepilin-type N-terminal cleavage/methylation domain-containing protein
MRTQGFSLVELSIVLVILGLLAGGILSGQSLIRAAELRAVPTEFQRHSAAALTFRDKYMALPGDMANAQRFWSAATHCPGTNAQGGTTKATCNGDGDGIIEAQGTVGATVVSNELFRFWQHLANAGLVEGSYSGVTGPNHATDDAVIGSNVPASKLSKAGFTPNGVASLANLSPQYFLRETGTFYNYGAEHATASTYAPVLRPEEAWNIDTKIDDGKPGFGTITTFTRTANGDSVAAINPNCASSDTASTAEYSYTESGQLCSLAIKTGL